MTPGKLEPREFAQMTAEIVGKVSTVLRANGIELTRIGLHPLYRNIEALLRAEPIAPVAQATSVGPVAPGAPALSGETTPGTLNARELARMNADLVGEITEVLRDHGINLSRIGLHKLYRDTETLLLALQPLPMGVLVPPTTDRPAISG
jgi:hypothetical protein